MTPARSLARPYIECTVFVLIWLAAEFYLKLTPLQSQFLGLPLILLFQCGIARRPVHQLWAFDAPAFKVTRRVMLAALALAVACVALLCLGGG